MDTYVWRGQLDAADVGVNDLRVITNRLDKHVVDIDRLEPLYELPSSLLRRVATIEDTNLAPARKPLDHIVEACVSNLLPQICSVFVGYSVCTSRLWDGQCA